MSSVEVLVKKLLLVETLPAVTAFPLVYIHVDLVLFLVSVEIVVGMEPALVWDLVSFPFNKRRQVLQRRNTKSLQTASDKIVTREESLTYILYNLPSCSTSMSGTVYLWSITFSKFHDKRESVQNRSLRAKSKTGTNLHKGLSHYK